ncbi:MAG: tetratricopeptide repeat protein [Cyanobacteria bacterium SIG26]|nr:tetratricopeptide repeat protein [Cyanobacteria bacterium SIG26]
MKKTFATLAKAIIIVGLLNGISYAGFREHFDLGQSYMTQYQYSGAITEFKSALKINYLDTSARIGLINAYLARATEYANKDRNWAKAADDYRSALFYMTYYPETNQARNHASNIPQVEQNLDLCLDYMNFNMSAENRYNTAKRLRAEGNFPAAAYEFNQALGSKNLQKSSFEQVGDIMKILGNEPKAAEFYQKAIFVAPTDLDLRLSYAKILDNLGSHDLALKEYSYVLEKAGTEDKNILYVLERTFNKKVQSTPNNANFNANLGAILQKEGRLDEALNYYKQAETLDPSNLNTRINTGTLYQQKGDYRTAIKAYESVLILEPNNINANIYRAQCYEKLGDTKTAQEGFKKVMALDPDNKYMKAHLLENAKKTLPPEQFVEYVKTNMADSNPSNIIYNYAIDLHKKEKLTEAITMYNAAIQLNSQNSEMYVNLALAQAQSKNYNDALNTLQSAKSKFPSDKTVQDTIKNITSMKTDEQLLLAANAYKNKNYQEAIQHYLSITPATANTMLGVATAYQELQDTDNALIYYKKALELKPIDSDIAYAIACLYGEKEDYTNAKNYLEKAITFNKNNTQAIEYLQSIDSMNRANLLNEAITLYEANNHNASLSKLNEIISKDPMNAYAFYYRGMIYDARQQRKQAIADMQKAYELNKEFTICNYLIASDYDALGQYKDAYDYYLAYANSNAQDDEYKQYAKARAEELKEHATK